MKTVYLSSLLALLFAGCTSLRPTIHEYTILPSYTVSSEVSKPLNATLKLSSTKSIASLSSTQLYYLKESTRMDAYLYSRWSDAPSHMIDRAIYSSLQNQHLFETLIPATSSATADLTLESDLHAFYHRFLDDTHSEGFMDITYRLIDTKTKRPIASKRFVIIQPSPSADAQGGVSALNSATHTLSDQCTAWINVTMKENKWTK